MTFIKKMTPLDDAVAFDVVASNPATNGYSSIRVLHPIIRGYINLHQGCAPLWVRLSFLLWGKIPEAYTKEM